MNSLRIRTGNKGQTAARRFLPGQASIAYTHCDFCKNGLVPSHERVWFSPNFGRLRWAGWLRRRYAVSTSLPAVQELAGLRERQKTRVVLMVDAERDDLDHLREVAAERLPLVRIIGAITKRVSAPMRGLEWFERLQRDSSRVIVEKTGGRRFRDSTMTCARNSRNWTTRSNLFCGSTSRR